MKIKNVIFLFLGLAAILPSCEISSKDISYNEDQCAFCKMIISDKRFGAELVTTKGKVYKYDAVECMLRVLVENGEDEYKYIMLNHFDSPSKLYDGKQSHFLVSQNLPSPMGGFLSAFKSKSAAMKAKDDHGGSVYDIDQIINIYKEDAS